MTDRESVPNGQARGAPTILVVDDEDDLLNLIAQFFRTAGYNVLTSSSGARALFSCRNLAEPIDLVLLDFNLPDMNGLRLVRALNQLRPDLRCAFMTGNLSVSDSFLAEGYPWICKPFSFDRLLEFVKTLMAS